MKKEILPSIILSVLCLVLLSGIYTGIIWAVAQLAPNKGDGFVVNANGKTYYANIGQKFTEDKYFWSRPSAVDYNAAGSGGSNKGPSNPDYLATVQQRIDTFVVHNPGVNKASIPSELVTASGSGLDPDITVQAAEVQVKRIANVRHLPEDKLQTLIADNTQGPWLGIAGPEKVNVLKLNIALDQLK
jgi:potassium-transporting ATPase KdpC subunit